MLAQMATKEVPLGRVWRMCSPRKWTSGRCKDTDGLVRGSMLHTKNQNVLCWVGNSVCLGSKIQYHKALCMTCCYLDSTLKWYTKRERGRVPFREGKVLASSQRLPVATLRFLAWAWARQDYRSPLFCGFLFYLEQAGQGYISSPLMGFVLAFDWLLLQLLIGCYSSPVIGC